MLSCCYLHCKSWIFRIRSQVSTKYICLSWPSTGFIYDNVSVALKMLLWTGKHLLKYLVLVHFPWPWTWGSETMWLGQINTPPLSTTLCHTPLNYTFSVYNYIFANMKHACPTFTSFLKNEISPRKSAHESIQLSI